MDRCPECGASVKEDDKTCSACGVMLTTLKIEIAAHINLLRKKIERDPSNIKLYIDLGDLFKEHKFIKEALAEYQKAAKIDNTNFDVHFKSAKIYFELKELGKAEEAFRAALHINPKSSEALKGLFRTYYFQKRVEETIVVGERIVQAEPNNLEIHRLLKELYSQKGDKDKVLMELEKMESHLPGNIRLIKEIVTIYEERKDVTKSLLYYQKIHELDAKDVDACFYIGKYYLLNKEYDKAIDYLKDLVNRQDLLPETITQIRCYLAVAYLNKGDFQYVKSIIEGPVFGAELTKAEDKKMCADLYYKMALNTYENNKFGEAITFLEKAVCHDSGNTEYRQFLQRIKDQVNFSKTKIRKKVLTIVASIAAAVIIVVVLWTLTHNKIIFQIIPADKVRIVVNGKPIKTQFNKPGTVASSTMFIGEHKVVIEKEGYEKWQGKANIGFGRKAMVKADLVPRYGNFKVNSQPESSKVYLDGKFIGATPYSSGDVLATAHKINIEAQGYLLYSRDIIIAKGGTIDLGIISLKNLAGLWRGKIGDDASGYNASFNMTIKQSGPRVTLKYYHQPSQGLIYNGEIKGSVSKNEFLAEGNVNCKYLNVFYWTNAQKKVVIKGKISDDWKRIEGTHYVEDLGGHNWWAIHKK